jgi:hypothetical protein
MRLVSVRLSSPTSHLTSMLFLYFYLSGILPLIVTFVSARALLHQRDLLSVDISPCLYNVNIVLHWSRPLNSVPFRPGVTRLKSVLFALLLLAAGDIHPNPGPLTQSLHFGLLNINSIRNKATLVQDIIRDYKLDILALTETRLQADMHPAIRDDAAPPDFTIRHIYRPKTARHPHGGGLAVVSRNAIFGVITSNRLQGQSVNV